jgi:branched-chain amino acid transport system ATP-binding protein
VLRERRNQLSGDLAGGEQQMLGLAMAFIAKPELLMIDELSLGLAPTIVEQLLGIVRRIQESGTAIILVEQHAKTALAVTQNVLILNRGRVAHYGPSAALLADPERLASLVLTQ